MTLLFYTVAFLAFAIGIAHSVLGERYILVRLFRRDNLPQLFGGTQFTMRTLRFAWHVTTIAWWGFAAILILLGNGSFSLHNLSFVIGVTFLITGTVTLLISRGQHLAWPIFFFIAIVCLYVAIMLR